MVFLGFTILYECLLKKLIFRIRYLCLLRAKFDCEFCKAFFLKGAEDYSLVSGYFSDINGDFLISGQKKSTPEDAVVSGALGGI